MEEAFLWLPKQNMTRVTPSMKERELQHLLHPHYKCVTGWAQKNGA